MVQKTIKALYKQPINYKLIRDGYKTVNGVIQAQDGMPATLELPTPSETYVSDLQYTVDINANGAPILNFNSFTLPDDEICESKQYCYAPKGMNYNYIRTQEVEYKEVYNQNFVIYNSPTIDMTSGIATNFSNGCIKVPTVFYPSNNSNWEFQTKIKFTTTTSDGNYFLFNGEGNPPNCGIGIYVKNSNLALDISTDASSWTHQLTGANTLSTNVWYWIKLTFDGTTYILSHSTDKTNWIIDIIQNGSMFKATVCLALGAIFGYNGYNGFSGPIDLFETYIKVDDRYWWSPWIQKKKTEEVITQIPGMLDPSITTDNWEQSQNYKLYQLKTQQNSDTLQLTENNITNNNQKYNQYINQITIPARNYKWYYHGIPEGYYEEFGYYGDVTIEDKVANFEDGTVYFHVYPRSYYNPFTAIIQFETGDLTSNEMLLDITNWHYNSSINDYEQKCIYYSCIRNNKFCTTDDIYISTPVFNEGTTLLPNTKYWLAIYLNQSNVETYLLTDNDYSKYSLPLLSSWIKQTTINLSYMIDVIDNEWQFGQANVFSLPFTGKLYLENCIAFDGLTTSYDNLTWEAYYYYNYEYKWMTNKSIYAYNQNTNTADTLDFSDSYINVSQYTYNQYKNKEICLMSINGGETVTTYSANGAQIGNVAFNTFTSELSNFTTSDYLSLTNMQTYSTGTINSLECIFKIHTPTIDNWTANGRIINGTSAYDDFALDISQTNATFCFVNSDVNNNKYIRVAPSNISSDTDYWIKITYDGTDLKGFYSLDGETYTLQDTIARESSELFIGSSFSIGNRVYDLYNGCVWKGIIDLKECQIKINNQIWWTGASIVSQNEHRYIIGNTSVPGCLYNYIDDGSSHNFDIYYDSNYTQPILVDSGQTYTAGTKVDTITIGQHDIWTYQLGGIWTKVVS